MPIVPPLLDDRTWQDLRDEALARVPIYTPEWTDLRPGDPGVTLVELFAYLTEALVYRLNRVPDNNYVAFLNLLDSAPRPAEPASGLMQFGVAAHKDAAIIDRSSVVSAGKVKFATQDSLAVLPLELSGYVKCHVNPPKLKSDAGAYAKAALQAHAQANATPTSTFAPVYYTSKQYPPSDGSTLPLSRAIDGALWVAILARTDDLGGAVDLAAIRAQLAGQYLSIGFAPDANAGRTCTHCTAPPPDTGGNRAIDATANTRWRWQASAPAGLPGYPTALGWNESPGYQRVQLLGDSTNGLSQPGVIKLKLPDNLATWDSIQPAQNATPVPLASFPRGGDLPPFLDDGDVEKRVVAWLRALPKEASDTTPPPKRPRVPVALSFMGPNMVAIQQAIRQAGEKVGPGIGQPFQQLQLAFAPVLANTLKITVNEDGALVPWTEVDNFDAADERASVFMLDRALGLITVGDGLKGRVLPDQALVTADEYWYGGGLAGNLPAGAITKLDAANTSTNLGALDSGKTLNPIPTTYGSETETVDQARRRVPMILRHQNRAVTADDFRELAGLTPGVAVGRAEVLPLYRPGAPPTQQFPGVVTVLVIPSEDVLHPRAPEPDLNFRTAVCNHLDKHRLITTELYIIGPRYQPVGVSVGIKLKTGFGIETVTNWICLALHQYFAPLPPYGPDGAGWPLGGKINRAAVEAAVLQVDGVAWVEELTLYRAQADGSGPLAGFSGTPVETITLGAIDLPELVKIDVDLNHAPPPVPVPPAGDKIPVPVPAPRTTC